ncbi:MAG: phosphoribosylglycinamide formyltransferase [Alphaproteobacteria bacterium CG11_big_fil_rev_8_21_14_0_20_44_7]|nr:MAG: phosphoribosylglycinamide formyltransferase [Alphaproteobacteria bacterium CG11_big_fil_rev_8_21_14_0_20_44_7]
MNKTKIAVLISGRGSNLKALIEACAQPDFPAEIALVISNKKDAGGLKYAEEAGITYKFIDHKAFPKREAFDMAIHEEVIVSGAQLICLAGFMRIISAEFITLWKNKIINIHPSLLPAFKGVDTHKRALEEGCKYHGCTVHFVVPDVDSGPIIAQSVVEVRDDDTEETLAARVLEKEHEIYPRSLRLVVENKYLVKGHRVETWG